MTRVEHTSDGEQTDARRARAAEKPHGELYFEQVMLPGLGYGFAQFDLWLRRSVVKLFKRVISAH